MVAPVAVVTLRIRALPLLVVTRFELAALRSGHIAQKNVDNLFMTAIHR